MLLLGVFIVATPKGTPQHVRLGKVFYWCMIVSIAAAIPLMLMTGNWFLLLLSVLSFYMLVSGRREVARHRAGEVAFSAFDRVFTLVTLVSCLCMIGLGVSLGIRRGFGGFAAVLIGLGAIGANLARDGWKRRDGPPRHKLSWMADHLAMMMGCFIAACTAFAAVNLGRIEGVPKPVIWLGPSVLLVPLIVRWSRDIDRRAGAR